MRRQRLDTRTHLVEELRKLPQTPATEEMIAEALAGEYHNYKNQKYMCGKTALVLKLMSADLFDLAKRVEDGEFDEEADEEDLERLRLHAPKEWWPMLGL